MKRYMQSPTAFMSFSGKRAATIAGLLFTTLAAIPTTHAAPFATGTSTTTNFIINSSVNWQTIRSIFVPSSTTIRRCQAVASLDAINPGGTQSDQQYIFTLSLDNSNPFVNANGAERTIEVRDNGGTDDPNFWPVSTNQFFSLPANATHTIRLLGRKVLSSNLNLTVDDASLSIICI